mmetsp:Transcript_11068/g.20077  ORF Transcript_11068/g.20077 Transcript_11068/m.20077 type:complete len:219 (+) Transcript_11068:507-1163(+)
MWCLFCLLPCQRLLRQFRYRLRLLRNRQLLPQLSCQRCRPPRLQRKTPPSSPHPTVSPTVPPTSVPMTLPSARALPPRLHQPHLLRKDSKNLQVLVTDPQLGVEPDLVELKISKSETKVGFDSLFVSSNLAEDTTFFLFLEGENTEHLLMEATGNWQLCRNDNVNTIINLTNGNNGVLLGLSGKWNLKVIVDLTYSLDLMDKKIWVTSNRQKQRSYAR